LKKEDIKNLTGNATFSFFSVDGCHNFACTLSDLELALASLHENGIIMIDDFFNKDWPGVALATGHFLGKHESTVTAIAYGENKMYIVRNTSMYENIFTRWCGLRMKLAKTDNKELTCCDKQVTASKSTNLIYLIEGYWSDLAFVPFERDVAKHRIGRHRKQHVQYVTPLTVEAPNLAN